MALRKVVIVPTLLTLGNAVCGLAAIAYASRIGKDGFARDLDPFYLAASGWLILAAMAFDAADGYFARLFKSAGQGAKHAHAQPDFPTVHRELRGKGVTLFLLWQEYRRSVAVLVIHFGTSKSPK